MRKFKRFVLAVAAMLTLAATAAVTSPVTAQGLDEQQVMKKVRKELVTLPYYGVFDNLAYKVEGGTVTLLGQVVQPSTRSDAERRVLKIKGVERVVNQIEVLPLSGFDNSTRARTYRALQRTGGLYRYLLGANPSLHIVVNRGHVTLEGVVGNEGDRRLAYITANSIPGVFSVTNNLRTDREARTY
jgi:hyperosmotically inducible periplasmic protein